RETLIQDQAIGSIRVCVTSTSASEDFHFDNISIFDAIRLSDPASVATSRILSGESPNFPWSVSGRRMKAFLPNILHGARLTETRPPYSSFSSRMLSFGVGKIASVR